MAAKVIRIRDAARVMELPLADANNMAKLIPERPGTTLAKASRRFMSFDANGARQTDKRGDVLRQAIIIEVLFEIPEHNACGVIYHTEDMTRLIPVSTAKESTMLVTQFDNSVVEMRVC